jgi:sugar O-acyltransferase (sialic acid O-acetyltransferase NeuD family)
MKNISEEGIDFRRAHDMDGLMLELIELRKIVNSSGMPPAPPVKLKTLAVIGAGGHGHVVADAAEAAGRWGSIVFFDDREDGITKNDDWRIAGSIKDLFSMPVKDIEVIVAIGNNHLRRKILAKLVEAGYQIATVIHPSATVSRHAIICEGTAIMAKAVVNIGAVIGRGCIINTSASVDHDCRLGDAVHISPGANLAGNVAVGHESWIGIASCVREGIVVDRNVVVGAGAVVIKPVASDLTVVGNPIRILHMVHHS